MGLDVFAHEIRIQPGLDGSFVVQVGERTSFADRQHGFTNVVDLMTWLQRAAQAQQAAEVEKVTILNEEQMVAKPAVSMADLGLGAHAYATRRTTALGSLADRIAAAETPKGAA